MVTSNASLQRVLQILDQYDTPAASSGGGFVGPSYSNIGPGKSSKKKGGGGPLSVLGHILEVVDTPRAAVFSLGKELADTGILDPFNAGGHSGKHGGFSLSDLWNQTFKPEDRIYGSDVVQSFAGPGSKKEQFFGGLALDAALDPLTYLGVGAGAHAGEAAGKIAETAAKDISVASGRAEVLAHARDLLWHATPEKLAETLKDLDPQVVERILQTRQDAGEAIKAVHRYGPSGLTSEQAAQYGIEQGLKVHLPGGRTLSLTSGNGPLSAVSKARHGGAAKLGDLFLGAGAEPTRLGKFLADPVGKALQRGGGDALQTFDATLTGRWRATVFNELKAYSDDFLGKMNKAVKGATDQEIEQAHALIDGATDAVSPRVRALADNISEANQYIGEELVRQGRLDKLPIRKGEYFPSPITSDTAEIMTAAGLWAGGDPATIGRSFAEHKRTLWDPETKTGGVGHNLEVDGEMVSRRIEFPAETRAEAEQKAGEIIGQELKKAAEADPSGQAAILLNSRPDIRAAIENGDFTIFRQGKEALAHYAQQAARSIAYQHAGEKAYLAGYGNIQNALFGLTDEEIGALTQLRSKLAEKAQYEKDFADLAQQEADAIAMRETGGAPVEAVPVGAAPTNLEQIAANGGRLPGSVGGSEGGGPLRDALRALDPTTPEGSTAVQLGAQEATGTAPGAELANARQLILDRLVTSEEALATAEKHLNTLDEALKFGQGKGAGGEALKGIEGNTQSMREALAGLGVADPTALAQMDRSQLKELAKQVKADWAPGGARRAKALDLHIRQLGEQAETFEKQAAAANEPLWEQGTTKYFRRTESIRLEAQVNAKQVELDAAKARLDNIRAEYRRAKAGVELEPRSPARQATLQRRLESLDEERQQLVRAWEQNKAENIREQQDRLLRAQHEVSLENVHEGVNEAGQVQFNINDIQAAADDLGVDDIDLEKILSGQADEVNPAVVSEVVSRADEIAIARGDINAAVGQDLGVETRSIEELANLSDQELADVKFTPSDLKPAEGKTAIDVEQYGPGVTNIGRGEQERAMVQRYKDLQQQIEDTYQSIRVAKLSRGDRVKFLERQGKAARAEYDALYEQQVVLRQRAANLSDYANRNPFFVKKPGPAVDEALAQAEARDLERGVVADNPTVVKGKKREIQGRRTGGKPTMGQGRGYMRRADRGEYSDVVRSKGSVRWFDEVDEIGRETGNVRPYVISRDGSRLDLEAEANKIRAGWRAKAKEELPTIKAQIDHLTQPLTDAHNAILAYSPPKSVREFVNQEHTFLVDTQHDTIAKLADPAQADLYHFTQEAAIHRGLTDAQENIVQAAKEAQQERYAWRAVLDEAQRTNDPYLEEIANANIVAADARHSAEQAGMKYDLIDRKYQAALKDKDLAERARVHILRELNDVSTRQLGRGIRIPNEIADQILMLEKHLNREEWPKWLQNYHKLVGWMKKWQIATPGFHIRNTMGGIWNNALGDVSWSTYPKWFALKANPEKDPVAWDFIRRASGHGQSITESGFGNPAAKLLGKNKPGLLHIPEVSAGLGNEVESFLRQSMAYDVYLKGGSIDEAVRKVHKFHFNYDDLSKLDQQIKEVIPFYTFTRNNLPLQVEMIFHNPKWFARYEQARKEVEKQSQADPIIPGYFTDIGAVRLPWTGGGGHKYLVPDLPIKDLNLALSPLDLVGGSGDLGSRTGQAFGDVLSQVTPVIAGPLEWKLGRQFYKDIPLRDDRAVALSDLHVPSWVQPIMKLTGMVKRDPATHKYYITERDMYLVDKSIPILARFRRGTSAEDKYSDNRLAWVLSFFGGTQVRSNTKEQQQIANYLQSLPKARQTTISRSLGAP